MKPETERSINIILSGRCRYYDYRASLHYRASATIAMASIATKRRCNIFWQMKFANIATASPQSLCQKQGCWADTPRSTPEAVLTKAGRPRGVILFITWGDTYMPVEHGSVDQALVGSMDQSFEQGPRSQDSCILFPALPGAQSVTEGNTFALPLCPSFHTSQVMQCFIPWYSQSTWGFLDDSTLYEHKAPGRYS